MLYLVYVVLDGVPATGLSLTWNANTLHKASDGTTYDADPNANFPITEIALGFYKFTITPTQLVVGGIDASVTITIDRDRYIPVRVDVNDDLGTIITNVKIQTDKMNFSGNNILAKIEAKNASIALSAQEKLDVNAEVDTSLVDNNIDTINTNVGKLVEGLAEGTVQTYGNTAKSFKVDLNGAYPVHYKNLWWRFNTGVLLEDAKKILSWNPSTQVLTFTESFGATPGVGDAGVIINR